MQYDTLNQPHCYRKKTFNQNDVWGGVEWGGVYAVLYKPLTLPEL